MEKILEKLLPQKCTGLNQTIYKWVIKNVQQNDVLHHMVAFADK